MPYARTADFVRHLAMMIGLLWAQGALASSYQVDFLFDSAIEEPSFDLILNYEESEGSHREIGFYNCLRTSETITTCDRVTYGGTTSSVTIPTLLNSATGITSMNFGPFVPGTVSFVKGYSNSFDAAECEHCGAPLPAPGPWAPEPELEGKVSATVSCKTPPGGPGKATCTCNADQMICTTGCGGDPPSCTCTTPSECEIASPGAGVPAMGIPQTEGS